MRFNQYFVKSTKTFSNPYTKISQRGKIKWIGQTNLCDIIYYEELDCFYRCGVMIIFTLILFKG